MNVSNRTTLTRADKNRNAAIAHLHHEGLMDMKPILNRGIGKRLNGIEWICIATAMKSNGRQRIEMNGAELICAEWHL